jgi:3-hydroxyisobutyrate dehydrogenase
MLTDGPALRSVLLDQGVLAGVGSQAVLIDLSTIDVPTSQEIAHAADVQSIQYVRGAVSGTPQVVREGSASLLISGNPAAITSVETVLTDIAPTLSIVGNNEEARVVKIMVNSLLGGTTQMLAEATVVCEAQGIPREIFLQVLESTVIASRFSSYKSAALLQRDYKPTFTTADMCKDMTLATELGASVGVTLPIANLVREQLEAACTAGYQSHDFLSLICLLQLLSGQSPDINGD